MGDFYRPDAVPDIQPTASGKSNSVTAYNCFLLLHTACM